MADHIPFVTGEDAARLASQVYPDSQVVRIPLDRAGSLLPLLPAGMKVWLDPCVDGMHDVDARRSKPNRPNSWFDFMHDLPHFEKVGASAYHARPVDAEVRAFVRALLDRCAAYEPAWITVPQLPLARGSQRNRINRALATATGRWKDGRRGLRGRLVLPLVFTQQSQVKGRTERRPRTDQAIRCYEAAQADGFWVVETSLDDEGGASTLRKRFGSVVALHEELNDRIPSTTRIAGPYWGLNLVLWAKGLVDYAAIGVGSGYQYFMAGGHANPPDVRLALPSLRRRVVVGVQFRRWLDAATHRLAALHPAHTELSLIRRQYTVLTGRERAREQVVSFYKEWFDTIAAVPETGRSLALFQDLAAAYALGKSLPDLAEAGSARKPEAVVEPLMLNCL
jgi:hypothetical protein